MEIMHYTTLGHEVSSILQDGVQNTSGYKTHDGGVVRNSRLGIHTLLSLNLSAKDNKAAVATQAAP